MRRTRVKICGTTSVGDAVLAVEAGADALGLIFARSPRRVEVSRAREISLAVGPAVGRVGVFLGAGLDEVLRTADAARLGAVQIHGEVSGLYLDTLLRYAPVLRVVRPGDSLPEPRPGLTLLFDAPSPGSGLALDWEALRGGFPPGAWLAGGLNPGNVSTALDCLAPAAVDAVSGLEAAPGVKDPAKVMAFVQAVRTWDAMRTG